MTSGSQRRVLIAIDMSHYAEEAFDLYVREMHKPGTEVICFYSLDRPSMTDECDFAEGLAHDAAFEGINVNAQQVKEKYEGKMRDADLNGRMVSCVRKKPGEAIVDTARAEHVTLIVLGTRGLNALKRVALHSVSDHVLHHAHCPVVIASISSHRKIERRRTLSQSSSLSSD